MWGGLGTVGQSLHRYSHYSYCIVTNAFQHIPSVLKGKDPYSELYLENTQHSQNFCVHSSESIYILVTDSWTLF